MLSRYTNRKVACICLLLIAVAVLVYGRVFFFDFTNYDDGIFVYENPHVTAGVTSAGLSWALTTSFFDFWHPLTWSSHMLDWELFGSIAGWHHLVNVGLHIASTLLLFLVLREMTGAIWRSAIVAALFALHPLHAESVGWISERKDVLSGLFFMLTLWCWAQAVRSKPLNTGPPITDHRAYLLALIFFALGLMSKAMLVTVPFVLLLLDYWPLHRVSLGRDRASLRRALAIVAEKTPFFALSIGSCIVTYVGMSLDHNLQSAEKVPWGLRLANIPVSYARYISKTFWPIDLAPLYPMPEHWPAWQVCAAVLLLLTVTLLIFKFARPAPYAIVGWFLFLGMLVPVIGIVPNGLQSIADRYMYLPSIGLFLVVVWAVADISGRLGLKQPALVAVGTTAILSCSIITWHQLGFWRDSVALWTRCLAVTQNNATAEYNMGVTLRKLGHTNEAVVHLERAVQIKPEFEDADNLGVAFAMSRQFDKATNYFAVSLRLNPNYAKAHENYGWALLELHDYSGAILHCRRAVELDPGNLRGWAGLARAYAATNELAGAARCYLELAKLQPDNADVQFHCAAMLDARGAKADAAMRYRKVLRLNSDYLGALNNLAWLLATSSDNELRDGNDAIRLATHACELTSYSQPVLIGTLAAALAEAHRFEEASQIGLRACELARSLGDTNLAAKNEQLVKLYQRQQPCRQ